MPILKILCFEPFLVKKYSKIIAYDSIVDRYLSFSFLRFCFILLFINFIEFFIKDAKERFLVLFEKKILEKMVLSQPIKKQKIWEFFCETANFKNQIFEICVRK